MGSFTSDAVIDLVRNSSVSRLKTLTGREDISISEIEGEYLVLGHWMSFILVAGEAVRIIFKTHFMTETAQFLAAPVYGAVTKDVSVSRALDFFKEYCNLTAGQIKFDLALNEVKVGASLPGLIRGFDEVFYLRKKDSIKNNWYLTCGEARFACSLHFELFDDFKIEKRDNTASTETGNIEYL